MDKNLNLKAIKDLSNHEFIIPEYQRGYRWEKQQIEELLNDISEFDPKQKEEEGYYCLQPVIVKKEDESTYSLIDGQQRLITIYLILKKLTEEEPYQIKYKTKNIEEILKDNSEDDINSFYIQEAVKTIKNWFDWFEKAKEENKEEIEEKIKEKIKIIWYELKSKEEPIDIFIRINSGKIPLTNAELIKALMILNYSKESDKKIELGLKWDNIEYSLQNDDFWYFMNKEDKATRIDFIFELLVEKYKKEHKDELKEYKDDKYYIFHVINLILKKAENKKKKIDEIWEDVINYHRILTEWYEDKELFHKIGYLLIYSKYKHKPCKLIEEYLDSETKKKFIDHINKEIKNTLQNIKIDDDTKKGIRIKDLEYENDKENIKKILFLFNIETYISNNESKSRFQFDLYKKNNWDIEHIRSQKDKYPENSNEKEDWLSDIDWEEEWFSNIDWEKLDIKKSIGDNLHENLDGLKGFLKKTENEPIFKIFFDHVQKYYEEKEEDTEFNIHGLGNLAILDSDTNRSYKNAFFNTKRKKIIEKDEKGKFIPNCTKNVFLKYYSKKYKHINKWTAEDAKNYLEKIEKKIK
jgi:uncharacterized protein with ParB-like and HNH nuclease domain